MKRLCLTVLFIGMFGVLQGCQPLPTKPESEDDFATDDVMETDSMSDDGSDVTTSGLDDDCTPSCEFPKNAIEDPNSPLAERLIFFGFDKSDIKAEFETLIINHGKYLAAHPDVKVRLEGHTDERGSREYNLALGEQRAMSVRKLLLFQGAPADSINVVSFGEELPLDLGHDESAWSQNRRVELVYDAN